MEGKPFDVLTNEELESGHYDPETIKCIRELNELNAHTINEVRENTMEEQTNQQTTTDQPNVLGVGVGTKEVTKLQPTTVKIVRVESKPTTKSNILECYCKHPDREEEIKVSKMKWEHNGKLETTGLWINLDEDKLIRKGSALAMFLQKLQATTPNDLNNKEVETVLDESGYLAFKNY